MIAADCSSPKSFVKPFELNFDEFRVAFSGGL